jgi:DNA-binding transcriptional MerR regulator/effector-binding domain-containing protein
MAKNLLPIGRFSKICRLTVKALRHYDEIGLLHPALVDPESGYRYYSVAQAAEAEQIRLLRALELPLDEIKAILDERDRAVVRTRLDQHRQRIEEKLAGYQRILDYLGRLIDHQEGGMPYEVKLKQVELQPILGLRTRTSLAQLGRLTGRHLGALFGYLGGLGVRPVGPPMSIYHDPEFLEDDVDWELCVPVERRVTGDARMNGRELPAGKVAYTVHAGPYDEVGPAYCALMAWIRERGHQTLGPPREVYLVGPDQAGDPSGYRTEIAWPVE